MKIAHIVSTFPPYHGGMGNSVAGMASALAKRGHKVTVVTPRHANRRSQIANRNVPLSNLPFAIRYVQPMLRIGNAALLPQLLWHLQGYDIVHLHYPFFGGGEFVALWKQFVLYPRPCPLVVSYHMDAVAEGWKGRYFAWYNRSVMPRVFDCADQIVVTTEDYAAHSLLAGHTEWQTRIVAIPHGVDIHRFDNRGPSSVAQRTGLPISDGRAVILFVGALDQAHTFKGVDVLLRAMKFVIEFSGDEHPTLTIVGDGDLRQTYATLARELGIESSVRFVGRVADDDLSLYYAAASCLVLPSVSASEAFGLVLLEAMAAGKPVITSNLPGVRSVVVEGETGLLVKPGDIVGLGKAILEMLEDDQHARAMGNAGRRRVEKEYTWDHVGALLEACYRELL